MSDSECPKIHFREYDSNGPTDKGETCYAINVLEEVENRGAYTILFNPKDTNVVFTEGITFALVPNDLEWTGIPGLEGYQEIDREELENISSMVATKKDGQEVVEGSPHQTYGESDDDRSIRARL